MSARWFRIIPLVNPFFLAGVFLLSAFSGQYVWLGVVLVWELGLVSVLLFLTNGVKRELRARGYEWVESFDAVDYARRRGTSTRDVPLHSDMLLIPGYDDVNIESLCECLERIISELGTTLKISDSQGHDK